jgi:hypothetical protein
MRAGVVYIDPSTYEVVGRAADGIEVSLGNMDDREHVERYLVANPSPQSW